MAYVRSVRFKNHGDMIFDLRLAGVKGISDKLPEAELVFKFNLQFLPIPNYKDVEESRLLGQNNSRTSTGKFKP